MSHHNKINWTKQVSEEYEKKLRLGESKFEAKQKGTDFEGIYSTNTFHAYVKHFIAFGKYCEKHFGCRTIPECREHVDAYLRSRSDLSAYTVKLDAAAIFIFILQDNTASVGIPDEVLDVLASCFLPDIIAFFESDEGKAEFEAWKAEQKQKKEQKQVKAKEK